MCEIKTKLQECQTCTSQKSVDDDDNVDDDDDEAQPMKGNDEELTEPGSSYLPYGFSSTINSSLQQVID